MALKLEPTMPVPLQIPPGGVAPLSNVSKVFLQIENPSPAFALVGLVTVAFRVSELLQPFTSVYVYTKSQIPFPAIEINRPQGFLIKPFYF